jgi:hypothetical protein
LLLRRGLMADGLSGIGGLTREQRRGFAFAGGAFDTGMVVDCGNFVAAAIAPVAVEKIAHDVDRRGRALRAYVGRETFRNRARCVSELAI